MESNGKSIASDGSSVKYTTGRCTYINVVLESIMLTMA